MTRTSNALTIGGNRVTGWHVLICLVGLIMAVGCSEKPSAAPPLASSAGPQVGADAVSSRPTEAAPSSPRPRPTWDLDTSTNAARMYIDLSGSMQGYQRGPQSHLQSLARGLKASLVAAGVSKLEAVGFGTSLEQPVDGATLLEALAWRANRQDTCLKLPIAEELRAFEASRRRAPRLMIVVTDGVVSAQTAGACGRECATASDQTCLATAIRDYVNAGFAFSVFGVKLPFQGTFYPAEGGAAAVNPAVPRPIYLWIGSPSARLGHEILADAFSWAQGQNLQAVALNVWPGLWTGPDVASLSTSRALAPPQGTMDVCAKRNNVVVDALPTGEPPVIRLRAIGSGQQHTWAARLPLAERNSDTQETVLSLFQTDAKVTLDRGSLQWNLDSKETAALVCVSWAGNNARLQLEWSTSMSTAWQQPLGAWSEQFGRGVSADPSRTEGLSDLWTLTARLISSTTTPLTSSLLEITVK